jgi:hypothetical protein
MINRNEFIPDYAVSPGEILEEELVGCCKSFDRLGGL